MKVFHSPQAVSAGHDWPTTRKAGWTAKSLIERPIEGVEIVEPRALAPHELDLHDPAYVAAVLTGEPRDLAESQGFDWDPTLPGAMLAMNGGMVAAALEAHASKGEAPAAGGGARCPRRLRRCRVN